MAQHPFTGKGKPKNVTVNFVSRKGAMQLSWGGKGAVPLETIYSVTKGIKTNVSSNSWTWCFLTHGLNLVGPVALAVKHDVTRAEFLPARPKARRVLWRGGPDAGMMLHTVEAESIANFTV